MSKRLETLLEKRDKLNAQIRQEENRAKSQKRREENKRKILIGAMIQEWVKQGRFSEADLQAGLDTFLSRNSERSLFDLPALPEQPKKKAQTKEEQRQQVVQVGALAAQAGITDSLSQQGLVDAHTAADAGKEVKANSHHSSQKRRLPEPENTEGRQDELLEEFNL